MECDCEAVRLVPDPLDQLQRGRALREHDGLRSAVLEEHFLFLGNADQG